MGQRAKASRITTGRKHSCVHLQLPHHHPIYLSVHTSPSAPTPEKHTPQTTCTYTSIHPSNANPPSPKPNPSKRRALEVHSSCNEKPTQQTDKLQKAAMPYQYQYPLHFHTLTSAPPRPSLGSGEVVPPTQRRPLHCLPPRSLRFPQRRGADPTARACSPSRRRAPRRAA